MIKKFDTYINESVRDLMKGKSDEEIKNVVKNLAPNKKMSYAIENDLLWLAEEAVKEGLSKYYLCLFMNESVNKGNLDMIKLLVNNGVEIGNSQLVKAIINDNKEIVKYLLKHGESLDLDVEDEEYDIFMKIVDKNNIEMVKIIIDSKCGFYLDEEWLDDFIENSEKHEEMLKLLIKVPNIKKRVKFLHDYYEKKSKELDKYL